MDVRLRLPDDPDGIELKQLYDWLLRDRELHRDADISLATYPVHDADTGTAPGADMGDALDVVQLVLDAGFQLASLGIAVVAWRRARRPRSSVILEYGDTRVILPQDASPEDVARFRRALGDVAGGRNPEGSPEPDGEGDDR